MELFSLAGAATFGGLFIGLTALGAVNLLYVAIEAQRARIDERPEARRFGAASAAGLRVLLLLLLLALFEGATSVWFEIAWANAFEAALSFPALALLCGGVLAISVAMRETAHFWALESLSLDVARAGQKSKGAVIARLLVVNIAFSFLAATLALAFTDSFAVIVAAIAGSSLAMLIWADSAPRMLEKNRGAFAVGLFVLLIAGVDMLSNGADTAEMKIFDAPIDALSRSQFYLFAAVVLSLGLAQRGYQKKLLEEKKAEIQRGGYGRRSAGGGK